MQDRFKFRSFGRPDSIIEGMQNIYTFEETENGYANVKVEKGWLAFVEKENLKIMQCTGLKDKNGREIYDGDILKFKLLEDFAAFGTNEKYVEIIAPVIYEYGGFFIEQSENSIFLGQLPMSEIEVIGNIYENSELLEVTNKENKEWK